MKIKIKHISSREQIIEDITDYTIFKNEETKLFYDLIENKIRTIWKDTNGRKDIEFTNFYKSDL